MAASSLPAVRLPHAMDRRIALRNLRTGLIAGAISLLVFAAAFVAALVYT